MDLTTLITACALTVDPKIMHALIWHQSGGEPWSFTVSGQREPHVLQSADGAVAAARTMQPDIALRIGLAGLPAAPRSVTAAMFAPCSNIASAARQIAQLAELCSTSRRAKDDSIHCAVAAWHGSWERPDNKFADAVRTSVANNDAPDFEMPTALGIDAADSSSGARPVSPDTALPGPSDDDERARLSSLFPAVARPSDRSPNSTPTSGQTAAGERKTSAPSVRFTVNQPDADGLFVPRSKQRSSNDSDADRNDDIPKF